MELMPQGYPGGYAAWYQNVVKPRHDSLTQPERKINTLSHLFGNVDSVRRCIRCEIGEWNGWQRYCPL